MTALRILEIVVIAVGVWFVLFQIIFPAAMGLPLFPLFRSRRLDLESKLAEQKESEELDSLSSKLKPKDTPTNG